MNNAEEEEYVNVDEVAEEYVEDPSQAEPIEEEEDIQELERMEQEPEEYDFDGQHNIEIDMSNNSWAYFDKHTDSVFTIFEHPKLPLVVTGGGDNTAYMWTTHSQPPKLVTELKGHNESVIAGGFSADGDFLVTGDMTGKIQVFKASKKGQKWDLIGAVEEIDEICWITVHPKHPVFAFGGVDGSVWCYSIEPELQQIMSGFSHQLECNGGRFVNTEDLDSLNLVTISEDGSIVLWNCYMGQPVYKIGPNELKGASPSWVSMAVQNNILAIGSRDGNIAIVNSENGSILTFFKVIELNESQDESESSIEALSWCDVQPILAVGLVSGDLLLFDTKTWKTRRSIKVDDAITKVKFLAQSPVLFGSSMNGKIYKWDSRTGEELFVAVGHNMGILDFVANETKVISAGDEGVSLVFVHNQ